MPAVPLGQQVCWGGQGSPGQPVLLQLSPQEPPQRQGSAGLAERPVLPDSSCTGISGVPHTHSRAPAVLQGAVPCQLPHLRSAESRGQWLLRARQVRLSRLQRSPGHEPDERTRNQLLSDLATQQRPTDVLEWHGPAGAQVISTSISLPTAETRG